jgi:multisubunit Na+/H+ antiporter MnhB subunit
VSTSTVIPILLILINSLFLDVLLTFKSYKKERETTKPLMWIMYTVVHAVMWVVAYTAYFEIFYVSIKNITVPANERLVFVEGEIQAAKNLVFWLVIVTGLGQCFALVYLTVTKAMRVIGWLFLSIALDLLGWVFANQILNYIHASYLSK